MKRERGGTAEGRLSQQALAAGYDVYKNGWPDYVLVNGDEILFVEVKTIGYPYLSIEQVRMLRILGRAGLKVRIALEGQLGTLYTLDEWLKYIQRKRGG
jgi:Holliday junction resolvase